MADSVVVEDDDEYVTVVPEIRSLGHLIKTVSSESTDPFSQPASQIKMFKGVGSSQKRRITNELKKVRQGSGGAESKQEDMDASLTGYSAFAVVEPQYNMNYLAKLYNISTPHSAACRAKMANIVGLGYTFIESPKTKRRLDDIEDSAALDKFRKKLSRSRDALNDALDGMNKDVAFIETLSNVWIDYEVTGNG